MGDFSWFLKEKAGFSQEIIPEKRLKLLM